MGRKVLLFCKDSFTLLYATDRDCVLTREREREGDLCLLSSEIRTAYLSLMAKWPKARKTKS